MSEDAIEKKRKKGQRRRSARVYVNANKPLAVPLDEIAGYFPPDDDDDDDGQAAAVKRRISQAERKRLAREGNAVVNPDGHISYPIETPRTCTTPRSWPGRVMVTSRRPGS